MQFWSIASMLHSYEPTQRCPQSLWCTDCTVSLAYKQSYMTFVSETRVCSRAGHDQQTHVKGQSATAFTGLTAITDACALSANNQCWQTRTWLNIIIHIESDTNVRLKITVLASRSQVDQSLSQK